jgi:Holliday junction resolvasome RuvABC ATP-dependent DNA helicase subunit
LDEKLKLPQLRQLNQRITLRCRTQSLCEAEIDSYIASRLRMAGAAAQIFLPEAAKAVFRHTHGIPRLVNVLCEHSLISAYVDQQHHIRAETVDRVAKDLEIDATASVNINSNGHLAAPREESASNMNAVIGQLSSLNEQLRVSAKTALKGRD